MAKKNRSVPQYGTVMRKGILYYRTRIQDADGKWYYFDMAAYMEKDSTTPDGYYVDANGVWDGNPSTRTAQDNKNLGPGVVDQ